MQRKITTIIGGVILVIAVAMGAIALLYPRTFALSPEYYHTAENLQKVDVDELEQLINQKKSFALLVYQPGCRTSEDFEQIVKDYGTTHGITFLKIPFSKLWKTGLIEGLKYYPSIVLYREGQVVTFLHADSDEDVELYQNPDKFATWWQKHVAEK